MFGKKKENHKDVNEVVLHLRGFKRSTKQMERATEALAQLNGQLERYIENTKELKAVMPLSIRFDESEGSGK